MNISEIDITLTISGRVKQSIHRIEAWRLY